MSTAHIRLPTNPSSDAPAQPMASSVDPAEVARYHALADTWWDPDGPFWPLHRLNALRAAWLRETLSRYLDRDPTGHHPLEDVRVLDIGCGGGILSESMAALGARVRGIDVVERNIHIARLHARRGHRDVRYDLAAAETLAQEGETFDVVLNMEVVEHVADLPGFVSACNALVRPGGLQVIATINRTLLSLLTAKLGAEYVLGWLPRGTHRWRRFVQPHELAALLARDGLEVVERQGVKVNPLNRRMSLTGIMTVNYMLMARKA